ncbi:glycosyltransferase [Emticicia soli]|uniref:Glycosyltransferase n=1 Tax=Emticicia soli TaxID=2027878 RepID=A0ABW5J4W1_9BACT
MKKSGLLFIPASIRSHIIPAMYLADLLADKYEIYFAVTDEILTELVEKNGYKAVRQSGMKVMFGMESDFIVSEKKAKVSFLRLAKAYKNNELFNYRKKELGKLLEDIKPAGVIIDIFSSTDYLVLKTLRPQLNVVFFNPMLSTYRINGYPIVSEGSWLKSTSTKPGTFKKTTSFWTGITQPKQSILAYLKKQQEKQIFQKSGVPEDIIDKDNHFTKMFRGVPELIAAPLEFEVSPNVKQEWQHYLGLCTRLKRKDTELDNSFVELWPDIKHNRAKGQKIIYCSFGTYYNGPNKTLLDFVENLLNAIAEIGNIKLLISVNSLIIETARAIKEISPNVYFFSRVPQLEVLKETDLFITHGGLGSIKEAIDNEVPLLVYPLDLKYDQNGNGLKVELHKIGLRGNFAFETKLDIKRKIEELLLNASFKKHIKEMKNASNKNYTSEYNRVVLNSLDI